ncbi:MAG: bifunctional phosphoribosyl-AMP cyclohydrolase/phosphoribosyl-ATP diphosphatase HisIE [Xanthomonadales bacterium]|nr:bifunctional phosphoribosyl-AMP cyclohydrolase/phosphoribosyl-ATP diphosphatase HisIE [Xanthomonadales bacterium]
MLIAKPEDIDSLDWEKMQQLIPAIVQDSFDGRVLMQGYMNPAALKHSLDSKEVTFWSRSQQALWTKGETSGNYLNLKSIHSDCDNDCLLILAEPAGPTCHTGAETCFDSSANNTADIAFIATLENLIATRKKEMPAGSYTTELFNSGIKRIAQKVGEEGVETSLAAVAGDDEELLNESADLVFHLLVLLQARGLTLKKTIAVLKSRHQL